MQRTIKKILCFIGAHHWSDPGGHCIDCGKCDELFYPHYRCRESRAVKKYWEMARTNEKIVYSEDR
jgi:hypothetical protein